MIIKFPGCPSTERLRLFARESEEVSFEEGEEIEEHLLGCQSCLIKYESYSSSREPEKEASLHQMEQRMRAPILGVGVLLLIAIAAQFYFGLRSSPTPIRAMELAKVEGQVATSMGSGREASKPKNERLSARFLFVATSPINLVYQPKSEEGHGTIESVEVYTGGSTGLLRQVPAKIRAEGSERYPIVRVSGGGSQWFRGEGNRRIVVRFAAQSSGLKAGSKTELCEGALCIEEHIYFESD